MGKKFGGEASSFIAAGRTFASPTLHFRYFRDLQISASLSDVAAENGFLTALQLVCRMLTLRLRHPQPPGEIKGFICRPAHSRSALHRRRTVQAKHSARSYKRLSTSLFQGPCVCRNALLLIDHWTPRSDPFEDVSKFCCSPAVRSRALHHVHDPLAIMDEGSLQATGVLCEWISSPLFGSAPLAFQALRPTTQIYPLAMGIQNAEFGQAEPSHQLRLERTILAV